MAYNPLESFDFEDLEVTDEYEVKFIEIDKIKDNKDNKERTDDFLKRNEDIESFKMNLLTFGQLEPIIIKDLGGDRYKIISGHYRKYCMSELFKEGKEVSYKGRKLFGKIACIIESEDKDTDSEQLKLIASNARNNSVREKIYRTKMAMDIWQKKIDAKEDVDPNRNRYIAMVTGYSERSVQDYINEIKREKEGGSESQKTDLYKGEEAKAKATKMPIKEVISSIKKLNKIFQENGAEDLEYYELSFKELKKINGMIISIKLDLEIVSANCLKFIRLAKADPTEANEEGRWY